MPLTRAKWWIRTTLPLSGSAQIWPSAASFTCHRPAAAPVRGLARRPELLHRHSAATRTSGINSAPRPTQRAPGAGRCPQKIPWTAERVRFATCHRAVLRPVFQPIAWTVPVFESGTGAGRRRSSRYMVGTKIRVANVANSSPPITARPSRVLLAALADAERHRHHAEDHRTGSHQRRAQACRLRWRRRAVQRRRRPCADWRS